MRFDIERVRREGNEKVNKTRKEDKKKNNSGIDIDFILSTSLDQLMYMNKYQ